MADLGKYTSCSSSGILADRGAVTYLKQRMVELKDVALNNKLYILLPQEQSSNQKVKEEALKLWQSYYRDPFDYEFIAYHNRADVVAIKNVGHIASSLVTNPIVFFNNMSADCVKHYWNMGLIANVSLISTSSKDWQKNIHDMGYEDKLLEYKSIKER